jgi:hypothetical protein
VRPCLNNQKQNKRAGGLPGMCKILGSISATKKRKEKKILLGYEKI